MLGGQVPTPTPGAFHQADLLLADGAPSTLLPAGSYSACLSHRVQAGGVDLQAVTGGEGAGADGHCSSGNDQPLNER